MREIKFRARHAELPPCWIFGYFVIENGHCFIICPNGNGRFKVIAGTQGQFTGLKDKNGEEIYEGDIVRFRFENYEPYTTYAIEWSQYFCQFRGEEIGGERHNVSVYEGMEVIGNVWQNKELLNDNK